PACPGFAPSRADRKRRQWSARSWRRAAERGAGHCAAWDAVIAPLRPLLLGPAPTMADLERAFDGPQGVEDLRTPLMKSIAEVLDEWFESEEVKAPIATGGVIGTSLGPRSPGTAYIKFHHLLGQLGGQFGVWGFVRGGMGSIATALAGFCRDHGVTILTDAEVVEVDVHDGAARGVRLADGRRYTAN